MIDVTYRPPEAPGYLPNQAFEATARSSLPNATKERRAHGIEETQGPVDLLELSPEAERRIRMDSVDGSDLDSTQTEIGVGDVRKHQADEENGSTQELTDDQKREVEELQHRDREVGTHEQAHVASAGTYVRGGIQYEYQKGPDNRIYPIGGHVSIDTSPIANNPEETIRKAQTVRQATLAAANPSPQDMQVAANASQMLAQAQREVSNKQFGEPASPSVSDVYSIEPEQNPIPNEDGTSVDAPPHVTPNPLFDVYERSFSTEFSKQQPGALLDVTS
ncbi:MAG TPA: hypothetical protein EYQ50_13795 [Verrucomicrobiales bacterium]|nr:hypothetical protein [Verrucomicrobiales bacterium]HIL72203.1 hypothetical protein [Verrucomicrobiota bacterium]